MTRLGMGTVYSYFWIAERPFQRLEGNLICQYHLPQGFMWSLIRTASITTDTSAYTIVMVQQENTSVIFDMLAVFCNFQLVAAGRKANSCDWIGTLPK